MIHPDLAAGARELLGIADAASDSGSQAELARIALGVIGGGLYLATLEQAVWLLDQELAEPH